LEAFYYAFGDVDADIILDLPDNVTAAFERSGPAEFSSRRGALPAAKRGSGPVTVN
jgi:hypothetical protein